MSCNRWVGVTGSASGWCGDPATHWMESASDRTGVPGVESRCDHHIRFIRHNPRPGVRWLTLAQAVTIEVMTA